MNKITGRGHSFRSGG